MNFQYLSQGEPRNSWASAANPIDDQIQHLSHPMPGHRGFIARLALWHLHDGSRERDGQRRTSAHTGQLERDHRQYRLHNFIRSDDRHYSLLQTSVNQSGQCGHTGRLVSWRRLDGLSTRLLQLVPVRMPRGEQLLAESARSGHHTHRNAVLNDRRIP